MKTNTLLLIIFLATSIPFLSTTRESNQGKKLWAKSFINEKAPELVNEKWNSKI